MPADTSVASTKWGLGGLHDGDGGTPRLTTRRRGDLHRHGGTDATVAVAPVPDTVAIAGLARVHATTGDAVTPPEVFTIAINRPEAPIPVMLSVVGAPVTKVLVTGGGRGGGGGSTGFRPPAAARQKERNGEEQFGDEPAGLARNQYGEGAEREWLRRVSVAIPHSAVGGCQERGE